VIVFWLLGAGIMFRDVTTLLLDHQAFKDSIDIFAERYQDQKIDVVAGEVAWEVDQSLLTDSFGQ
jgi:adenine/guanine phosphoribosyltransferase-like PRPP-binding protein